MFSSTPRSRRVTPVVATSLLAGSALLGLTACGAGTGGADSGRLQVVAAFYPLQYVAERVAGEHAEVTNLTQPGKEPHDLSLSVRQVSDVATAELVVFEEHFQAAVDQVVEEDREGPSVDAAAVVDLIPPVEHDHEEEHADEPAEEGHEEEGHEEHGDLDPHFWQDPLRMATLGDALAEELSEIDAAHAADYRANAATLRTDLEALDQEFATGLEGCERDTVVVSHDAFGYLAKYGVHFEPIAGLSDPSAEPNAATIAALHELIEHDGITTVFSETLVSPRAAEAIARDLGIDTAVLDPLEGLTAAAEKNGGDYLTVMRQNLDALKKANSC